MSVPEAPVYENNGAIFWQYNIRLPGQSLDVDAEPESPFVKPAPDQQLGFRVLAVNARHDPAACGFVDGVSHVDQSTLSCGGV